MKKYVIVVLILELLGQMAKHIAFLFDEDCQFFGKGQMPFSKDPTVKLLLFKSSAKIVKFL